MCNSLSASFIHRATMTRIAPLLALILTSSLLSCTAADASILCAWTKVTSNEEVHFTFLRQAASSLRLYHSAWSGERAHLLGCSWSDDAALIQNYFSLCQERTHHFSDHPDDEHFDLDSVFDSDDVCVSLASPRVTELVERTGRRAVRSVGGRQGRDERSEVKIHRRVKRGFIVPGTLWCGSGNKALSYADLGVFADTDSCCREHDQCQDTILSFHSQFGVFNSNIFTMSHCDCDNKFRDCLKAANDRISDVVGYTFFNLLKMHCFEFSHQLQCTQRNWFGMCKETEMALYADVHPPTLYESTSPTEVSMNSTSFIINTTTPAGGLQSSASDPLLFSIAAAASTVPTPSTSSPSASITPVTNVTTSTGSHASQRPTGSTPERRDDLENTLPTENQTLSEQDITEVSMSSTSSIINTTTPAGGLQSSTSDPLLFSIAAAASTVPTPSSASISPVTNVTTTTGSHTSERPTGSTPERRDDLENTLPTEKQTLSEQDITDNQLSCGIYKDLDQCRKKILPQQQRYGLHNSEPRTLYHCNCTTRFFQTLAKQRQLTEVHTLLLGFVSQSCFLLQDCTADNICTAVMVKAELPQLDQRSGADVEEQRHLPAVRLQVRRPNTRRAKRKDQAVRLHKLCLRLVRPKLKKTRKQAELQPAVGGKKLV